MLHFLRVADWSAASSGVPVFVTGLPFICAGQLVFVSGNVWFSVRAD